VFVGFCNISNVTSAFKVDFSVFFPDLNLEKEGKYKGHFISVRVKETRAYLINASCPARGVQVYRSIRGLGPLEMDKEKNYHRYEL